MKMKFNIKNVIIVLSVLCSLILDARAQSGQKIHADVVVTPFPYNSSVDDFAPTFGCDGKVMMYTTEKGKGQQILMLQKNGEKWSEPVEVGSEVNAGTQVGSPTMTSDGQFMVFAAYKHELTGFGRTDLYSARKVNGKWTDVRNLGSQVNSEAWDSEPSLSPDGSTLYFASDREGGAGGTDIYVSRRKGNTWSKAELVSGINTRADEACPSIAADNTTMYFTSNRDGGIGGYDIYAAKLRGASVSNIENMGLPVNSGADDYYYVTIPNTTIAYFSSNRAGGSGGFDIYKADPNPELPDGVLTLHGFVTDEKTSKPLGADLVITDLKSREKVAVLRSDDQSGEYYVTLNAGHSYSITATRPDYVFYSERVDVPADEKGRTVEKNIKLTPLANEAETRLLVFFDTDKADLKDESMPELDRAAEFLQVNKDIKVRIEGHTDDVGEDNYNMQLSQKRADEVKTYLVKQGVETKRILTAGYGKTRPKQKGTTDEVRALNRRVEMKVMK